YKTSHHYYEKLASTNTGANWGIWARYYCQQLHKAYEQAVSMGDLRPLVERQTSKPARALLEWVLGGGPDWFKRADYPNPENYSDVATTKALASLTQQGILEARGEKRGREYRLSTQFMEKAFSGLLA